MPDSRDLSRRSFVLGASATVAMSAAPSSFAGGSSPDHQSARLLKLSAGEAVDRISRGEITAERYASALLARCQALRALNSFITLDAEKVLEAARDCDRRRLAGAKTGALFGLPIPIKDSVNTQDYPTSAGTPALRGFRPAQDAPVVKALRDAGALVLGKTNLHELSFGWTSDNHAFGAVHNPYEPTRIPGGSSGGTAAAVAAHMAPLGVAEDTQGSIRVPAALCGICGFRPTTGRYSTRGCVPISPLFDQIGPHARTVSDLALFDSVVSKERHELAATPLKGVRLGIVRDYWFTGLDPEVERITGLALQRIKAAGGEIIETSMPGLESLIDLTTGTVQLHDVRTALARYLKKYSTGVSFDEVLAQASADIQETFRNYVLPGAPHFVSEATYAAARDIHLPALRRLYQEYFARTGVAAIVFPTTMIAATPIGEDLTVSIQGRQVRFDVAIARNISPGSTAGVPGLVLPAGLTASGLPVGIEFDAPAAADRPLLALGASLEQALGPIPPPNI
jgi:Asp-tRNA(Asn)/Glu-tRNA(Gln) amidotransferase A subunit family amidase